MQKISKYLFLVGLTALVIISGFAAVSAQSPFSTQALVSVLPKGLGNNTLLHKTYYEDFDIQMYPVLKDFVDRYETLDDLLANMEGDFSLTYDLNGDQNYYGQLSYNESPLALLTKAADNIDNTYQCFERTLLVALWAEQKFGSPPLILSFFTNDPENIRMNHSTYVFEVGGKWGYMSDNRDFIAPKYNSVDELAAEWMAFHGSPLDEGESYVKWLLIDLRNLYKTRGDWRTTGKNIRLYMKDVIKSGVTVPRGK
jgi:hypothetical protein